MATASLPPLPPQVSMRQVWANNFEKELSILMDVVDKFPIIAVDTEFPGVLVRPVSTYEKERDYHFQTLKANVDLLRLLQLGITFFDQNGQRKPGVCTWQFNFRFSVDTDLFVQDSMDMLVAAGMDLHKHRAQGIDQQLFAERIMMSGLVLNSDVMWIAFHGGYDFGYLLRLLTGANLPENEGDFLVILGLFFPRIFDIKVLLRRCGGIHGGLQRVADQVQVKRVGAKHQAGSDSLLTGELFFEIRKRFFNNTLNEPRYQNCLYGLGLKALLRRKKRLRTG